MNVMSCYICGADGEVGVRALCREHQQRLPLLEAENARLQEQVKEAEAKERNTEQARALAPVVRRWVEALLGRCNSVEGERDGYKAQSEPRRVALKHIFVTAEERVSLFPADGYWISVRDTAALAIDALAPDKEE